MFASYINPPPTPCWPCSYNSISASPPSVLQDSCQSVCQLKHPQNISLVAFLKSLPVPLLGQYLVLSHLANAGRCYFWAHKAVSSSTCWVGNLWALLGGVGTSLSSFDSKIGHLAPFLHTICSHFHDKSNKRHWLTGSDVRPPLLPHRQPRCCWHQVTRCDVVVIIPLWRCLCG